MRRSRPSARAAVLDGDEVVFEPFGLVFGCRKQPVEPAGDVDLVGRACRRGDFRQPVEFLLDAAVNRSGGYFGFQKQRWRETAAPARAEPRRGARRRSAGG